jgi:two-component system chemotaxis response regulator CheB
MPKIRVLVVDDAVVMRRLISEALARDPSIEVVGAAAHGRIALAKIPQVNPDVITLDVEMPEMDGITTVREIRKIYPKLPVIMFSTLTERGAEQTLDALAAGATDYVTKPANIGSIAISLQRLEQELVPKIKLHCRHLLPASATGVPAGANPVQTTGETKPAAVPARFAAPSLAVAPSPVELLCIGTSTGGPNALASVFAAIPRNLPVPIVIVQHMPTLFTKMLAERLHKLGSVGFCEGSEGQVLQPGQAYVAPGGRHMEVVRFGKGFRLHLQDQPPENSCRPAVDVLFRSAAVAAGAGVLAVVLTGMGQDGLHGCRQLREQHAQILAQDEASSVVWGMPGHVAQAGLADRILPLRDVAAEICLRVGAARSTPSTPAMALS